MDYHALIIRISNGPNYEFGEEILKFSVKTEELFSLKGFCLSNDQQIRKITTVFVLFDGLTNNR